MSRTLFDPCRADDPGDEPCLEDAGYHLLLDVDGMGQIDVRVDYFDGEWPPCANPGGIEQGARARSGERVQAFGVVTDEARMTVCDSPEYFIAVSGS